MAPRRPRSRIDQLFPPALRKRLETETEAETLRYESTYAGLMADCDAAERLRNELHATIETLELVHDYVQDLNRVLSPA